VSGAFRRIEWSPERVVLERRLENRGVRAGNVRRVEIRQMMAAQAGRAYASDEVDLVMALAELITVRRYYEEWADPRLVVCVLHNNDLNQVTWEMRAMGGTPKTTESQTIPDVSYADFAESIGLTGIAVDEPGGVGPAWDRALANDRPTVLDVRCDPDVPPIPPHVTLDQMTQTARALLKGDEDAWGVIKRGVATKAREVRARR
jgi:pyruvate dehydrogenase (quinone)